MTEVLRPDVYKQGDVVLTLGGSYTSKPRPVLVIQADEWRTGNSVIIVPITTVANPALDGRVMITVTPENGLLHDSYLEVEKLGAVDRKYLGKIIGHVAPAVIVGAIQTVAKLLTPRRPTE
ncbi:MAG: type II toxin-antitoxin system PemK/MazF family toxin [Propionibacteriaceae bacterium]|nr:type II toxin-antitoxin system PemK/MazF family toxin [Propionibacteriaceae bacterium]